MRPIEKFSIIIILLFSAALRFIGIGFGMPDPHAYPSYQELDSIPINSALQPDEYQFVTMPLRMILTGSLNPHYYVNPPLPSYLSWFQIMLTGSANNYNHTSRKHLDDREYAPFRFYVLARTNSALLGILAVAASWATARRMVGSYAALVAALLVTVSPLLVQYAHYAKNDSHSAGFVAVAVWACLLALRQERWTWALLLLAAVSTGAASASRYNASPVAIVLFFTGLIIWFRQRNWATAIRLFFIYLSFPLSFLLFVPGAIFSFREFWAGFTYGYGHYIEGNDAILTSINGRQEIMRYLMVHGMGIPAFGMLLLGLIAAFGKRSKDIFRDNSLGLDVLLLLVYLVPYTLVVLNPSNVFRSQALLIPPLPQFCIIACIGAKWVADKVLGNRSILRALFTITLILIPLTMSLEFVAYMNQADTRELMRDWIYAHIPLGSRIQLLGGYNVALDPSYYEISQSYTTEVTLEDLAEQGFNYAVVSDATFVNYVLAGEGASPELVAAAEASIRNYLSFPNRVAWIERPTMIGSQDPLFLAAYFHNPGLYIFCLTAADCAAVR